MIVRIDIRDSAETDHGYSVSSEGTELYGDAGFSSILHALAAAIEGLGPEVKAAELAFRGVVSGTYPLRVLATRPAAVVKHAVDTANAVLDALRD